MKYWIGQIIYAMALITIAILTFTEIIGYSLGGVILSAMATIYITTWWAGNYKRRREYEISIEEKINAIEEKRESNPEKTKYSWDVARIKLESYFDRNLSQINSIFWISIFILIAGFGFIICGIVISINKPDIMPLTYTAAIAGVITEFVGATVMVVYRSTMKQATQNMNVLERINQVGMAIQILDSIPDSEEKLQSETKAEITKLLLNMK